MNKLNLLSDLIEEAIKQGATDADAIIIESVSMDTQVRLGNLISIERSENSAISLRVLINQQEALVSTADFDKSSIKNSIKRAIAMAKVIPRNPNLFLATKDQLAKDIKDLNIYDSTEISAEELIQRAKLTENYALENEVITNSSGADCSYHTNKIYFATSNGFFQEYNTSSHSTSLEVIAGKDDKMQNGYDYSVKRFSSDLKSPKEIGLEAAQNAIKKLNPRKLKSCQIPVIFDRKTARTILASFVSAINGFGISRGTSFLRDHLGKEIFRPNIELIDDPFIMKGLASRPFDAEGIKGEKLKIIENGILNHYLLDLQTASKLNLKTNARASRGLVGGISPSCSNFYMQAGKQSQDEIIKSIKKGVLVTEIIGHGANIITGDYSQGATGFYIENGEILYPVSEITIASNLKYMLKNLIPANDLAFESNINSPSILIEKMTVAGV